MKKVGLCIWGASKIYFKHGDDASDFAWEKIFINEVIMKTRVEQADKVL